MSETTNNNKTSTDIRRLAYSLFKILDKLGKGALPTDTYCWN